MLSRAAIMLLAFLPLAASAQSDSFPDATVASSCTQLEAITPSDSATLARVPKAVWVGTLGTVRMIAQRSTAAVSVKNAIGIVPVRPKQILATGTDAADILACY